MKRKFSIALVVLLAVVGVGYVACAEMFPSGTWRYKMTVTVETPEGLKSGSAVREVSNRDNTLLGVQLPEAGARISEIEGEAVVIDLGIRGVLFALIEHGSYSELYSAFSVRDPSNKIDDLKKLQLGNSAQLPKPDWPTFITFKDIKDPKSITRVNKNDLSEYFGEGVKLSSIVIEIVDVPVTWGEVSKVLSGDFWDQYHSWVKSAKITDREFIRLFQFKQEK